MSDLNATIERLKTGAYNTDDIRLLSQALQAGQIMLASGEGSIALRDSNSNTIFSGDMNILFKGEDTAAQQALAALFMPRLHQLPSDLPDFTGREREMEELTNALAQGNGRVAISAIGGMGGVGKSALSVHAAHHLVDRYPDAQIVVDMRGTSDEPLAPIAAMANVIHAFHPQARLSDDLEQVAQDYHSTLAGLRALIVLDNASDAAQVRPLLPPSPCGLIVTSRRMIVLPGLRPINLDAMPENDARDLLLSIIGEGRVTGEHLHAIATLCGCLPLALRVAGTFIAVHRDWTADEYIEALTDERKRLARLKQDDLDVEAALALSAKQLESENADLAARWQMLAVFPADFDRAAAAAVWNVALEEARDSLSALLERSLVLYDEEIARYRLHDLVRLFTDAKLGEAERTAGQQHYAIHYKTVLGQTNDLYLQGGDAVKQGLAMYDLEWRNIQAGQAWAAAHAEKDDMAAELCSDYSIKGVHTLLLRQHPRDRIRWMEAALSAARQLKQRLNEGLHLGNLGLAYADLGETRRAIEYYEQQLALTREIGDRQGEGNGLNNLGLAYAELGETHRAIEYYEQALIIEREIGNQRVEGIALGNLGNAYADLGETRRAIEFYEQQLIITREIGDRRGEGNALFNMSLALDKLGDRAKAILNAEAALKIYEDIESPTADEARKQLAEWRGQE